MKYPGQHGMWRKLAIATGVVILVVIAILAALANTIPRNWRMMTGSVGSSAWSGSIAYDMMDSFALEKSTASASPSADEDESSTDQKIIKTGELRISVDGVQSSVESITNETMALGGFVQSSEVYEDSFGNLTGWITIRIPATSFESMMTAIKDDAAHVESETQNAQDVTEDFTDLEARLTAAQAQEAQYLFILEDATTVGEVLAVQEHLADVRVQIESLQGQLNYLENLTSYSTITVYLSEEARITFPTEKFDLVQDFKEAGRYVVILAQQLLTTLVWVVVIGASVGLPIALLAFIIWKVAKHLRRK